MYWNELTEKQKKELYNKILEEAKELERKKNESNKQTELTDLEVLALFSIAVSYNVFSSSCKKNKDLIQNFKNKISLNKPSEVVAEDILSFFEEHSYESVLEERIAAAAECVLEQSRFQVDELDEELEPY